MVVNRNLLCDLFQRGDTLLVPIKPAALAVAIYRAVVQNPVQLRDVQQELAALLEGSKSSFELGDALIRGRLIARDLVYIVCVSEHGSSQRLDLRQQLFLGHNSS